MRALAKTLSYGAMHLIVAIAVAYALTGDWQVALGIGIIEPIVQTIAYSLHERLWTPRRTRNRHDTAATAGSLPAT